MSIGFKPTPSTLSDLPLAYSAIPEHPAGESLPLSQCLELHNPGEADISIRVATSLRGGEFRDADVVLCVATVTPLGLPTPDAAATC